LLPASSQPSCHRPIHRATITPYPTQLTGIEQRPPLVRECPNVPMRLLHTTTFELKDFLGENTPEYAILSHTWGEEEILPTRMGTNGVGSIPAVSTKRVVQNCRRPSTRCSAGKSQLLGGLFPLSYCFRFRLRSSIQRLLERSTPKITERSMLTPRSRETGMPSRTCASSTSQTYG
jgi:hypothetical protein